MFGGSVLVFGTYYWDPRLRCRQPADHDPNVREGNGQRLRPEQRPTVIHAVGCHTPSKRTTVENEAKKLGRCTSPVQSGECNQVESERVVGGV
jgi:hypothetical protein